MVEREEEREIEEDEKLHWLKGEKMVRNGVEVIIEGRVGKDGYMFVFMYMGVGRSEDLFLWS